MIRSIPFYGSVRALTSGLCQRVSGSIANPCCFRHTPQGLKDCIFTTTSFVAGLIRPLGRMNSISLFADLSQNCRSYNIKIDVASEADVDKMVGIWSRTYRTDGKVALSEDATLSEDAEHVYAKYLRESISSKDHHLFVARHEDDIVGYIFGAVRHHPDIIRDTRYGYIIDVVINREARKRGAGRELCSKLLGLFRQKGITEVQLQARRGNIGGEAFWRKLGFRVVRTTMSQQI